MNFYETDFRFISLEYNCKFKMTKQFWFVTIETAATNSSSQHQEKKKAFVMIHISPIRKS